MPRDEEILSDGDVAFLTALVGLVPSIGRWIEGLRDGKPAAVRRVTDILPERSASAAVADELRARRGG